MKKLSIVIIALISLVSISVGCQDVERNKNEVSSRSQRMNRMNKKYKAELNLNESQEKQWDEIHARYRDKFMALKQEASESRDERIKEAESIAGEMDREVMAILDDDQKAKYKELSTENRAKIKARYKNKRKGKPGMHSFMQMKNELNLTDSQNKKWNEIQEAYKPEFTEIRASGQPGSEETRKEMIALIEKKNADIMKILDADQQAIYAAFVDKRRQMAGQRAGNN